MIPEFCSIDYLGSLANIVLNLFTLFSKRIRSVLRIVSDGIVDAAWIKAVASLPVIIGVLRIGFAIINKFTVRL